MKQVVKKLISIPEFRYSVIPLLLGIILAFIMQAIVSKQMEYYIYIENIRYYSLLAFIPMTILVVSFLPAFIVVVEIIYLKFIHKEIDK